MARTIWYDVCNDYSLDKCEEPNTKGYEGIEREVAGMPVTVWSCLEHNEVHYLSSNHVDAHMLQGMFI